MRDEIQYLVPEMGHKDVENTCLPASREGKRKVVATVAMVHKEKSLLSRLFLSIFGPALIEITYTIAQAIAHQRKLQLTSN